MQSSSLLEIFSDLQALRSLKMFKVGIQRHVQALHFANVHFLQFLVFHLNILYYLFPRDVFLYRHFDIDYRHFLNN